MIDALAAGVLAPERPDGSARSGGVPPEAADTIVSRPRSRTTSAESARTVGRGGASR